MVGPRPEHPGSLHVHHKFTNRAGSDLAAVPFLHPRAIGLHPFLKGVFGVWMVFPNVVQDLGFGVAAIQSSLTSDLQLHWPWFTVVPVWLGPFDGH